MTLTDEIIELLVELTLLNLEVEEFHDTHLNEILSVGDAQVPIPKELCFNLEVGRWERQKAYTVVISYEDGFIEFVPYMILQSNYDFEGDLVRVLKYLGC